MLVQMTMTRNELFLLREMLPIWKKYADAFVFLVDSSTDGTYEYLRENSSRYNILKVMKVEKSSDSLEIESNNRQVLFDEAYKHSKYLLCLDTDEYLDGTVNKQQLDELLSSHYDCLLEMLWIQYTGKNTIRVDGPWASAWAPDRLGSYDKRPMFKQKSMHSEHMPYDNNKKRMRLSPQHMFISHLQWIDKKAVATKQYYWKIFDYVNRKKFNANTIDSREYDVSVANFVWEEMNFPFELKVSPDIYQTRKIENDYKYQYIKENVAKYNIPNLNDWGMGIHT